VNLREAHASLQVSSVGVRDFFTIGNALMHGQSVPATVSYHIRWSGVNRRAHITGDTPFVADVIEDNAVIEWRAEESGFKFVSDPANTSKSLFAEIGRERNGVFFSN